MASHWDDSARVSAISQARLWDCGYVDMTVESLFQSTSFSSFRRMKVRSRSGFLFVAFALSAFLLASILTVAGQPHPMDPNAPPVELPAPVNVVYSFSPATNYVPSLGYTNLEGAFCTANLIQDTDGELYGVAPSGGDFGGGTVFSLNTNGNDFTVLHTFTASPFRSGNDDGNKPTGLILGLDGRLYGTTSQGGTNGFGAIFKLNTDSTGFTNLHSFAANDGEYPQGGLVQGPDGTLYGTAQDGGTNGSGTVFSVRPDGSDFTVLYNFTPLNSDTNTDGTQPFGGLITSGDGTLYGTARYGGPSGSIRPILQQPIGSGTIFSLKTNGAGFTVLHAFDRFSGDFITQTNRDGASPYAALVFGNDGKLYGTAPEAGAGYSGTIFSLGTNGSNYAVLHAFNFLPPNFSHSPGYGLYPYGGLIQGNDGIFYGVASGGGLVPNGTRFCGTIYRLNPDGSGLVLLHSFAGMASFDNTNADGANPNATLLKANDGKFYGMTSAAGINGCGTVFSFAPPVVLQVAASNGFVILTWPASATNFVLETSDTLSASSVWTPLTNNISTVSNNFTLTRSANSTAAFFRLYQP